MTTNIKEAYIQIFGENNFQLIEKSIDDDGWYCSEKNDLWLPLQPKQYEMLDFRNANRDFIPKILLKDKSNTNTSTEKEDSDSAKHSLTQEDDSFLIYPFENASEEEKEKLIKGFLELTAKHSLQIFKSLGLKVGYEGTVIEDTTGDKFVFSFKKIV